MIRQIRGNVLAAEPGGVTIDVAGLGIFVFTAASEIPAVGSEAMLYTHLAIKQDGFELYGFGDQKEREFFELALSVSGVGPKKALTLLRRAPRANLETAIAKRDIPYLTRVAGLGKKSAEKLVVELSEKMHAHEGDVGDDAEVFDTLVALGYTEREARRALSDIPSGISGKEERLRAALASGPA
ncbi:MAG: Holliday junction branch migration protein RuvA [Patescibacteria group bacterium]|nr:Holliday junction branch migration protein RuvA [Patescibacteria group bacterium]MDE1966365.1 Holliday junction branch migration protein RuvA [Patescibacteria group bacterium]